MGFRGRCRGSRCEVARRRAADRREVPFAGLRDRDGDGPVFEGIRRVDGVILDPDFADVQCLSEVRGSSQRRAAHREIDPRRFIEDREEFAVSPQVARSFREIRAAERIPDSGELVRDLEGTETRFAYGDLYGGEIRAAPATPAPPDVSRPRFSHPRAVDALAR